MKLLAQQCHDTVEEILRYFDLADNSNLDPSDKFAKVRLLITELNNHFCSIFW